MFKIEEQLEDFERIKHELKHANLEVDRLTVKLYQAGTLGKKAREGRQRVMILAMDNQNAVCRCLLHLAPNSQY